MDVVQYLYSMYTIVICTVCIIYTCNICIMLIYWCGNTVAKHIHFIGKIQREQPDNGVRIKTQRFSLHMGEKKKIKMGIVQVQTAGMRYSKASLV